MAITPKTYSDLAAKHKGPNAIAAIADELVDLWCKDYVRAHRGAEVVLVTLDGQGSAFTYLFDIPRQRNIVAYGVPIYSKHKRDASRMAGHPLSQGSRYHRGHLMAHSVGGGTDINLVPQLGSLNIGRFRVIERLVRGLAEKSNRCLYSVRTIYPVDASRDFSKASQLPDTIEQCVLQPPRVLAYDLHRNS